MTRPKRKCQQGHLIDGDNRARIGRGWTCLICRLEREAARQGGHHDADWVAVEILISGRPVPLRDPTYMEILIAAREIAAAGLSVHTHLPVSFGAWDYARRWARIKGVRVPSLSELYTQHYAATG